MNRKMMFGLIVLFVAIASLSSASAWWIFDDGGTDITINNVDFHIPEGFESYELPGNHSGEADYALRQENGRQEAAYIHIWVSEGSPYNFGNDYTEKAK